MVHQLRSGMVGIVVVVLIHASMGNARAQGDVGAEIGGSPSMHVGADSSATVSSVSLKVQMGVLGRVAGTEVHEEKSSFLLEADVLFLGNRNPRRHRGLVCGLPVTTTQPPWARPPAAGRSPDASIGKLPGLALFGPTIAVLSGCRPYITAQ
ncbi:MAG: hypothetical protein IPJ24_01790 [bacterium]|nr:hypothetical protein [bacterium]